MARVKPDYDFKLNDASLKSLNIIKQITIDLPITTQASSFTAQIYNEGGNYNDYFDHHDDIKIYLGYETEGTVGLFHGRIEKFKKGWKPSGSVITISGRGTWALMLEKFEVTTYSSTEYGDIIKDLISNNVPGLTTTNVEDSGITPASEVIDHVFINEKVSEYCKKAEFDAWVDFDDDLHFTGTPGANSVTLTAGDNIKEIELSIDWKRVRNYIRGYGTKVEDVQLLKTEEDSTSQAAYGIIMKIIKNESLDETSLIQSIVDAALLEDKDAEWGGMAIIPGDERIEPAKTIAVDVPELDEDTTYKVQHVTHVFDPKGVGFQTTVMLVQEEENTSRFYKELYEKTGRVINYANSGNYLESYVYKFTDDQDSLWTFVNCYTTDSTLKITDATSTATATIDSAIVGDYNYSKCLPYVSQEFSGANKFFVSNDDGSSWEQVYHDQEHTFVSSSGDKNDFKTKIEMSARPALEISSVGTDLIYGLDTDNNTLWSFEVPDTAEEIWGLAYGEAKLWECENSTGKIYYANPEDGSSETTLIDKAYELGGCTYHSGTGRLFVLDRTGTQVVEINTSTGGDEYTHDLPAAIGDPTGMTYDGTNFWISDKTDDEIYRMTTASTGDNVAWASTDAMNVPEVVDPYDMAWDGANLRVVTDDDSKVHRLGYGTATEQSQTTTSSNGFFGSNIIVAQSFQVSMAKDCSSVDIYLKRNATANDVTCILADDDSGDPGSTLKSVSNSSVSTSAHWEKFTWASPQALSASTTYWIIIKSTTSDYNDYQVYYNSGGGYGSGQAAVDLSTEFTEDFSTTTYRDAGNTDVEWDTSAGKARVEYKRTSYITLTGSASWDALGGSSTARVCYHEQGATNRIYVSVIDNSNSRSAIYYWNIGSTYFSGNFLYTGRSGNWTISDMCSDGTNLYLLDKENDGVSKRNASSLPTEDAFYDVGAEVHQPTGITFDGTYFWIYDSGNVFKYNSSFVYQSVSIALDAPYRGLGHDGTYFILTNSGVEERWDTAYYDDMPFDITPSTSSLDHELNGKRFWNYLTVKKLATYEITDGDVTSTAVSWGNSLQDITKATLTKTDDAPSGTSIDYFMSANGGSDWEAVTSGVEKVFSNPGTDLRWKAEISNPGGSAGWAEISNIDIEVMDGATPDWQLQSDDLAFKVNLDDILYDIDSFTPPGGSSRGLTYKTEQGASNIFTFGAYLK